MLNIITYLDSSQDRELIQRAFEFGKNAHAGQKRLSGEPYITHCEAVAAKLTEWKLDAATVAAGFLHDVLEDTEITKERLEKEFGREIAFLVDGVTKLKKIQYRDTAMATTAATLMKMIFAMTEDIRVMLIKLADRWHNLTTLQFLPAERQHLTAVESIEIYAPIAERLGMGEQKGQIEDLAFPYAYPGEYRKLMRLVGKSYKKRTRYLLTIKPKLLRHLAEKNIRPLDLHMRVKHYFSLWQKLQRPEIEGDPERVHDLVAIRIIVPDVSGCYLTLGHIHQLWRPLPGKFSDFIALPKPNGYRSLHTKVFANRGQIVEIQIRTPQMHRQAELGIAAHWAYSEKGKPETVVASLQELQWVSKLREWKETIHDPEEFLESIKLELFRNRIFVLTPKGDVKELPREATPVDFAYKIHQDLGAHCGGAKVNGRIVPINYQLQTGQIVEIIPDKKRQPSLDWLTFVKTANARRHIRTILHH